MTQSPETALTRYRDAVLDREPAERFEQLNAVHEGESVTYRFRAADIEGQLLTSLQMELEARDWRTAANGYEHAAFLPAFGLLAPIEPFDVVAVEGAPKAIKMRPGADLDALGESPISLNGAMAFVLVGCVLMLIGLARQSGVLTLIGGLLTVSPGMFVLASMYWRMTPHYTRESKTEFQPQPAELQLDVDADSLEVSLRVSTEYDERTERLIRRELDALAATDAA